MAPLPENNTNRLFVDYGGPQGPRTMQFRCNDGVTPNEAANRVNLAFAPVLSQYWYQDIATTGARWQGANSNFSLPVLFPQITGSVSGSQNPTDYPEFLSAVGRGTTTGRRVRLFIFGFAISVTPNYRLALGEGPVPDDVLGAIAALIPQGCFRSIGNDVPTMNQYLNAGYNARYQRKARES